MLGENIPLCIHLLFYSSCQAVGELRPLNTRERPWLQNSSALPSHSSFLSIVWLWHQGRWPNKCCFIYSLDMTVSDDQKCEGMFTPWRVVFFLAMHCLGAFKNKDTESLLWSIRRCCNKTSVEGSGLQTQEEVRSVWKLNPDSGPRRS